MKLFSTLDVSVSVHKAHGEFTHVAVNRGYELMRPVIFDSRQVLDLPLFQYAPWVEETERQIDKWKAQGGVLIEQQSLPQVEMHPDVTVIVECPLSMKRLTALSERNTEYTVIAHPMGWTAHDDTVDAENPPVPFLEALWTVCGGQKMTTQELAAEVDMPVQQVQIMKRVLRPIEVWWVKKRLAPERDELIPCWDWLESKEYPRAEISKAGFRQWVEELAKFGYIHLKKIQHFPTETPNWKSLEKSREAALKDLAAVRLLVESLPDHLST